MELALWHKNHGNPAFVEVTPHHLILTERDATRIGKIAKISPPLRTARDLAALRQAISKGAVDLVSSDHSPHSMDEKNAASIWDSPSGFPGVETMMPLLLDLASKGILTLDRLVQLTSTNVAKIFGLYPTKGVLRVGSKADLIVIDPRRQWRIHGQQLHSKCKWTPFEGRTVRGWIKYTILSGEVIAEETELLLKNRGKFSSGKPQETGNR